MVGDIIIFVEDTKAKIPPMEGVVSPTKQPAGKYVLVELGKEYR
jgi:hypothetical protein